MGVKASGFIPVHPVLLAPFQAAGPNAGDPAELAFVLGPTTGERVKPE